MEKKTQLTKGELQEVISKSLSDVLKTQPDLTELLTRKEVIALLKITSPTLWSWSKQGKLKSYGMGSRVYYKRNEVMESIINLKSL